MELVKLLFVWMLVFGVVWLVLVWKREIWKTVTRKVETWKSGWIMAGLFVLDLLAQGWMIFTKVLPISADEVYSISGAAFFAGYNWNTYMHMKKFYNFGYTMLLSPLYKIFTDPVAIYRGMLFCNVVVHAFFLVIAFRIVTKYLDCSKVMGVAIALISTCNAISLFFTGFIYNEVPLAFCVWVIVLLLIKLAGESGRAKFLWSALLGMVSAYAYIIHSRCVIIYGTIAVVVLLFLLVYKKLLVHPISFGAVFAGCLFLERRLVDYVRQNLYLNDGDVAMPNSVERVVTGTWRYRSLTSWDGIKRLIAQFFSLAGAMTIETAGLLTITTVAILYYVIKNMKKWRQGQEKKQWFIMILFSLISLWGMVVAVALTGAANGKIRFVAYVRYFMPFLGPFLMIGLVILKQYSSFRYRWIVFWSVMLTVVVGVVYAFYVHPTLYGSNLKEITSYYFFMAFVRYKGQLKFTKNIFGIALGLLVLFTGILLYLYRRKQIVAVCAAAMIFSVLLFWKVQVIQCQPSSERRYKVSNATNELLERPEMEDQTICCAGDDLFKKAVLVVAYDREDVLYDSTQFKMDEDTVMVCNRAEILEGYHPSYILQLDKNEWVGVWDERTKEQLEEWYPLWVE